MLPFIVRIRASIQFGVVGCNVGTLGYPAASPTFGSNLQEEKRCSTSRHDFGLTGLDLTVFWCHRNRHPTSTLIPRDATGSKTGNSLKPTGQRGMLCKVSGVS